jgi:two-component system C4-dicarboxylate transport response regulator DctD
MIFGQSEASDALRARARKVAEAGSDALILGPPGSGISKVAEVIHLCSSTPTAPFVKRGGAALDVSGLDQALSDARGGAIFIDEVTGLRAEVQAALLDRLDAGAGTRVLLGSSADLKMALAASSFNAELYYRLSGVTVRISALAERREDIPVLFRHYVEVAAEQAGLEPPDVTPDILSDLMARDWPGNGRALMSEAMRFALGLREEGDADTGMGLAEQMAQVEKSLLETALRRARGRAISAAETLKLPKKTFYDKLARYGIRPEDFRRG